MIKKIISALNSKWSIFISLFLGVASNNINEVFVRWAFSLSNLSQQIIQLVLPLVVFFLVSSGLIALGKSGVKTIVTSLLIGFMMNVLLFLSVYPLFLTSLFDGDTSSGLGQISKITVYDVIFNLNIKGFSTVFSLVAALITWFYCIFYDGYNSTIKSVFSWLAGFLMRNIIGCLIPLFIVGFIANIDFNIIKPVLYNYYHVVFVVSAMQYGLLFILMFLIDGKKVLFDIKHMFGAIIVGFTTMSSGMALPHTVNGLEKMGVEKSESSPILSIVSIPFTYGDPFIMPVLMFIAIKVFGCDVFSFILYLKCAFIYALLKHTCCNVAGGAALCLFPLMKNILGFDENMVSFVFSITIALDAFSTAANVAGQFFIVKFIRKVIRAL